MAQQKKRSVRPARGAASKAEGTVTTPPAPPAGTEEVSTDTPAVEEQGNKVQDAPEGPVIDQDVAQDAQNAPNPAENVDDGKNADSVEYIGANGQVATEESLTETDDDSDDEEETEGTKFKGGKRYQPKGTRVVPPKGRVIPAGGEITFDGIDFGTHIVATEDVYREVFQFNSTRPSYVLAIVAGSILPRTIYAPLTEED